MRIKTLILLGVLVSTSVMLAVGGGLFSIFQSNAAAVKANYWAQKIGADVFELSMLTGEYLLYRENRSRQQWKQKYESMEILMDRADKSLLQIDTQLNALHENLHQIGIFFDRLIELTVKKQEAVNPKKLIALEKRLIADIQTLSHGMSSNASIIVYITIQKLNNNARRAGVFYVFLGIAVMVIAVTPWFIFAWRINRPLIKLQEGIENFGSSSLDSRIGDLEVAEINAVARSFDEMASTLQQTTVSRDILAEEVKVRKLAEKKVHSILENTTDAIIVTDESGFVESFNVAAKKLFGYEADEVIGNNVKMLMPENHAKKHDEYINNYCRTGKAKILGIGRELEGKRKNGDRFSMHLNVGEMRFERKRSFIGVIHDITKQKQAENTLKNLNLSLSRRTIDLELANQELDAFAYSVSHDLRAPLRGVDGFSRLLIDEHSESLDEQAINYLNRIRSGIQRMGGLIESLLVLSRSSRAEIKPRELNLSNMVQSVSRALQDSDPDRKVTFEIAENVKVNGDQLLIQQVIENLIGNAWKYTAKAVGPVISFEQKIENGKQVISVRDNGVGFDMTYADKLFAPFQRLHSSKEFEGSGIGLVIVQRILKRHGGEIWADSTEGKGTVFSMTFNYRRP